MSYPETQPQASDQPERPGRPDPGSEADSPDFPPPATGPGPDPLTMPPPEPQPDQPPTPAENPDESGEDD
jgi:hypothetical protein